MTGNKRRLAFWVLAGFSAVVLAGYGALVAAGYAMERLYERQYRDDERGGTPSLFRPADEEEDR